VPDNHNATDVSDAAWALLAPPFLPAARPGGRRAQTIFVLEAVLSEQLCRIRSGADPRIAGTSLTLDQRAFIVVGVMRCGFRTPFFDPAEQVWIPFSRTRSLAAGERGPPQAHWLPVIAREVTEIPVCALLGKLACRGIS
jgi:hypothetical protein